MRLRCIDRGKTYHVVVLLGVALGAVVAPVPLPVLDLRQQVRHHVLLQVAFLSEAFAADLAAVGLVALVHAGVVEQVPGPRELFVALAVLALVDDCGLPRVFVCFFCSFKREAFQ